MDIKIISCTRGSAEDTALYKSLENTQYINEVVWFEYNTKPLSECYNEVINYYRSEDESYEPILLFIHDDVYLDQVDFEDKLIKYSDQFDVMGVAGSTQINTKADVIAWHLSDPSTLFGAVQHVNDGKYWMTDFSRGKTIPQQVITLDGLFIAMTPKAYNLVQFDKQFKWDFYDMDLCVSAYKKELTIGVVPISITHMSSGEGINTVKYKETQKLFMDKLKL